MEAPAEGKGRFSSFSVAKMHFVLFVDLFTRSYRNKITCQRNVKYHVLACAFSLMRGGKSLTIDLILVPPGMGVPTVTATRILKGQLSGQSGEETQLEMDKFPFVSLAKVCHVLSCQTVWDVSRIWNAAVALGAPGLCVRGGVRLRAVVASWATSPYTVGQIWPAGQSLTPVHRHPRPPLTSAALLLVCRHTTPTLRWPTAPARPPPSCAGSRPTRARWE